MECAPLMRHALRPFSPTCVRQDLKPSNLLFSPSGCLKLGDFGLARVHSALSVDPRYSHEVATRWYRSPELLFGARSYGFAVDVWSCGAIMFEMVNGRPLAAAQNDIEQLYKVRGGRGEDERHTTDRET